MRTVVRAGALALATTSMIALAPVATAAIAAPGCTWQYSEITAPDGFNPAYLQVTGADGKGNYGGYSASESPVLIRWWQGVPQLQDGPPGVTHATSGDMNSAGVQVINGLRKGTHNVNVPLVHSPETGYRELPVPPGLRDARAISIADNGDVVGGARRLDNERSVAVHWPSGAAPVVIEPPSMPHARALDIDAAGAILLSTGYDAAIWRDGQLTRLPEITTGVLNGGLVDGRVYGWTLQSVRSWTWDTGSGQLTYRDGASTTEAVNRHGLAAGHVGDAFGPAALWQDNRFLGELPVPAGDIRAHLVKVADDNTVFGYTSGSHRAAVRWHCA